MIYLNMWTSWLHRRASFPSTLTILSAWIFFLLISLLTPQPVSAAVDCNPGEIPNYYLIIPPVINRNQPANIDLFALTAINQKYANQRMFLHFDRALPVTDPPGLRASIVVNVDIGADGTDPSLKTESLSSHNPALVDGDYQVTFHGGPFPIAGTAAYDFPQCISATYPVKIEGGEECLKGGDVCVPGDPTAVFCNPYHVCSTTTDPPTVMLPELLPEILAGARCEYLTIPAGGSCASVNNDLTHTCGRLYSTTEGEKQLCCEDSNQCTLATGGAEIDPTEALEKQLIEDFNLCKQIPVNTPQRAACVACVTQGLTENDELQSRPTAVYTALGCIKIEETSFLHQVIRLLLSVSGLVALLSILAAAFLLSTSQGDSNKVKQARELITAAVSGLFFIIFSTIILDFIGVQILRIPGLS